MGNSRNGKIVIISNNITDTVFSCWAVEPGLVRCMLAFTVIFDSDLNQSRMIYFVTGTLNFMKTLVICILGKLTIAYNSYKK
jgi:hypothetical protein